MKTASLLIALICLAMSPAATTRAETIPVDTLKADFAALYAGLRSAHYDLYAHRSKADYDALFEETLAGIDTPLREREARVLFQRFVAYGKVAHARIDYDRSAYDEYRANGGKVFPVFLRIVDGRAYVGDNYSGEARLAPGSEILAINGTAMSEWLDRTAGYLSADTPYIAHSLLEYLFAMYLWEETGPVDAFELEIRPVEGEVDTIRIAALTREQMETHVAKVGDSFELDSVTREARLLESDVAYLRPGPFYNVENPESPWDATAFVGFIDDAFKTFIDAGATTLVIDLRNNPGGDNSFSDPMIAWFATEPFRFASAFRVRSSAEARASNQARLDANPGQTEGASVFFGRQYADVPYGETFEYPIPEVAPREGERFEGRVYVLIDRHSYSNAVTAAAMIQDYGFGTILGEKTSDMATTYGAMETFRLPATGFVVGFPKAHIVRPSGEEKSDGVTPDIAIRSPIVPTGNDAVLEAALDEIRVLTARE